MSTVLVTGGNGFLGRCVVEQLLRSGHKVRVLDLKEHPDRPGITLRGDICSYADCEHAVRGIDVIYHLAALYRDDVRPRSLYYDVNVRGTQILLKAAAHEQVQRVVFTSSFSVYGLENVGGGEESALSPVNDYGRSKAEAEKLVLEWGGQAGSSRSIAIVRPSVIFGFGNRGNVYVLLKSIATGRFILLGSGRNVKSMSFVENVAAFLCWLIEPRSDSQEIYNYADKPDLSVTEIVSIATATLNRRLIRIPCPRQIVLFLGHVGSLYERLTGRPSLYNMERVRKFVATTSLPTCRLEATGFVSPVGLREALVETIIKEFAHDMHGGDLSSI